MSDPVALRSGFVCMYMANHRDTLVAYVKHYGKVSENVVNAEMKSIDTKGMNLSYTLKSGGVGLVYVTFDPPLSGYEEVRPRLLTMKTDAQEGLGMLKNPKLTSFRFPSGALFTVYAALGVAYLTCAPLRGTPLPFLPTFITDIVFAPVHVIVSLLGFQPSPKSAIQIIAVLHASESLYTWYLCRDYVEGTFTKIAYIVSTLIFGFPIWVDLKTRVQEKRIESLMKAE